MQQDAIFAPMGALVLLTFAVLLMIPVKRFRAGFAGRIVAEDFRLGESANVPPDVSIPNRALMNLLEMPMLFYVICLALFVKAQVNEGFLTLAWVYVALRAVHTLIHLTYNNVNHRLVPFALSNIVLGGMWVGFFWPAA
ncbi:MAG TPA: MAPEG family protein [Rhizomicrobium sp.]|jgi:hypothetical protein|nr:MAPEG family protein [Rhizomicrobium sp.]